MYSYKLNNSYTVYVSYAYLNSCIKASKGANHHKKGGMKSTSVSGQSVCMKPLSANTLFYHNTFGNGRLLMTDDRGIMYIAFADKTVRFKYARFVLHPKCNHAKAGQHIPEDENGDQEP